MIEFLNELQSVGLTALFNPTFLFLLVVLFFLGRLIGWLTRNVNIWKFMAVAYFGIFLFRPLQDAGIVIGGIFILGVASMHMDFFRGLFGWAGSTGELFSAMRSPSVYRSIRNLEDEVADLKRQLHAAQVNDGGGNQGSSSTQSQWRAQAQARAAKSQGGGTSSAGRGRSSKQSAGASSGPQQSKSSGRSTSGRSDGRKSAGQKNKSTRTGRSESGGQSYRAKPASSSGSGKTSSGSGSSSGRASGAKAQSAKAGPSSKSQQQSSNARNKQKPKQSRAQSSGGQNQQQSNQSQGQNQAGSTTPGGMAPALRDRYLTILELTPGQTYSAQDIKAAWRKMAFKTHPDRGGSAAAFNEAFSAYKALR